MEAGFPRTPAFRCSVWQPSLISFFLPFPGLRIFLVCATPVYETNDDLVMQLIASGFYTGHPDAHLIFTNILIGWILRSPYGCRLAQDTNVSG